MSTENENAGTLTDKEGEDLFLKAFSEVSGQEYKPSEFVEAPVPEVEEKKEEVAPLPAPPTPEEPKEPAAKSEKTPEEEPKAPAPTIEALLEEFPEDKREAVKRILIERDMAEHRFRSHQGRLAAEHKARMAAEKELLKLRSKGASSPQDDSLAKQAKLDHAKAIEEWKLVVEAEPTLAKAVDALTDAKVNDLEKRLKDEHAAVETLQQKHAFEAERNRQWELVVEHVPNVAEVASSPEFIFWRDNIAPPGIRKLAHESIDHQDVLFVLKEYTPYAIWVNEQRNGNANSNATPAGSTSSTVADKISENRQNKSSPVVTGAAPKIDVSPTNHEFDDDTADRLFAEAYAKVKSR